MSVRKKKVDDPVILALACGATVETAARKTNVSGRTIYRRLEQPEFRTRLQEVRAAMLTRATAMLTASAMQAVQTLMELQSVQTPPAVRLGAARTILELGVKLRESNELLERITALEQQIGVTSSCG